MASSFDPQGSAHPLQRNGARNGGELDRLLDALPAAAYTCDAEGLITYFNRRAVELWGREPRLRDPADRFCGSFRLFFPDGSAVPHDRCWMARALEEGASFAGHEIVIERPDGGRVTVLAHASPYHDDSGRVIGAVNILVDITPRKQDERVLASIVGIQQEIATANLDLQSVMSLIAARTQHLTRADGAVVELVEGEEMVYRAGTGAAAPFTGLRLRREGSFSGLCVKLRQALRCDDSEVDDRVDREACRRVGLRSMVVVPLIHEGSVAGVLKVLSREPRAFRERDTQTLQLLAGMLAAALGRALAFEAVQELVAERTAALQASEERYRRMIEATPDGICVLDAEDRIVFVNPRMAEMLGYTPEEMLGRPVFDFLDEEYAAATRAGLERRRRGMTEQRDHCFRRRDGVNVCTLLSAAPLFDGEAYAGALAVVTDLTEYRKLEQQVRQSQKLEVIGQLAGGIAHDFNNMLAVINGFSELVLMQLPSEDPLAGMVREIAKAGERASRLTRQLLAFSRQQVLEPKVLDLNALVRETEKMLRRLIGEDVELTAVPAPGLGRVRADPGQVEQILLNLVVNARDAIPQHGRITIETGNLTLDEEYARVHVGVRPGEYVMLAVSDTGTGMTEEVKQRIFEPFFTTKEQGRGTGLGLATVFGIVRQSGGHIEVYSEIGRGTAFKIYLPRVRDEEEETERPAAVSPHAWRGNETILVAEDDDAVRRYARQLLERNGYTVLEAEDGPEALAVCEQHPGPIHLLLSDVVMPGLGGRELAERVIERRPEMRVLFLSGYTPDAVIRHGVLEAHVAFLQKPFTADALSRKIREVLGA